MAVADRVPELALVVTVEEAFVHCTKCMVRSRMWRPDTSNSTGIASFAEAIVVHARLDMSVAEAGALAGTEARRLY